MKNFKIKFKSIISFILCLSILSLNFIFAQADDLEIVLPLNWASKFGETYRDAPSPPAYSDGFLYVMSGKNILKLNANSGETDGKGEISRPCSLGVVPPTVENNTVFCPLSKGVIEAFNKDTLQKLWTFTNPSGGQALTEIVFSENLIYTGFWNDEDEDGSFVCLDALDGSLKWKIDKKGGFYWATAAVIGDYLVFGSDDGTVYDDRDSKVYCVNKYTGEILDTANAKGDIRGGIAYSPENMKVYFASKAGYIYSCSFNDGVFGDLSSASLGGASTNKPVISSGRVYIGVDDGNGNGGFKIFNKDDLNLLYNVPAGGYPQGEGLLIKNKGETLLLSCLNNKKSELVLLRDNFSDSPSLNTVFTPQGDMQGYTVSPVSSGGGSVFYKNDAGYIFSIKNSFANNDFTDFIQKLYDIVFVLLDFLNSIFK